MLLKKCFDKECNTYTLKELCPKCGEETNEAHYKFRERFVKDIKEENI